MDVIIIRRSPISIRVESLVWNHIANPEVTISEPKAAEIGQGL
jgi:hypothetical protein